MSSLAQAIQRAIPLVEAQTGATFDTPQIVGGEASFEVRYNDCLNFGYHDFRQEQDELSQNDLDALVYEVLMAAMEALTDDDLGSVS